MACYIKEFKFREKTECKKITCMCQPLQARGTDASPEKGRCWENYPAKPEV